MEFTTPPGSPFLSASKAAATSSDHEEQSEAKGTELVEEKSGSDQQSSLGAGESSFYDNWGTTMTSLNVE